MSDPRSVILVTVDSIRADHCGFMGYDRNTTPTLDRVAREGLVFENAIATASATHDSATTFLAGDDPINRPGYEGSSNEEMREHIRRHMAARHTLPERFAERGYETAAFTANPWASRYFGFDAGFDHFEDFMDTDTSSGFIADGQQRHQALSLVVQAINWWQGQNMFMSWEGFYDDIVDWVTAANDPYFLWIFLVDVHLPYLPGPGYRTRSRARTYPANLWAYTGGGTKFENWFRDDLIRAYDDSIRYTDEFVHRLLTDVDEDEPLLVVHGDHGEEFGEHGRYGHGIHLYEELVHVPLVVANGTTDAVERPFSLRRLPELALNLSVDGSYDDLVEPYVISQNRDPRVAVRGSDWKYIWHPAGDELYDPADEHTDLGDDELRELGAGIVEAWRESRAERERIVRGVQDLAEREHI